MIKEADNLENYPQIKEFLDKKEILDITPLKSRWRRENVILKVDCKSGRYVFKMIKGNDKVDEIERVKILKSEYPFIFTSIHAYEENAYLMDFIEGKSFFELNSAEKTEKINLAGRILTGSWNGQYFPKKDIRDRIKASFERYREKGSRFFSKNELVTLDFSIFSGVSSQPSHNDLNAANLLYNEGIKLIDPSNEGYEDISRDIGRYLASCFFNNYDYFGNDKKASLSIAYSFLCNFSSELLDRAKYYAGESFLSFLNFDTISVSKETLKKLAINTLTKDKAIIKCLEDSL